MKESFDIAFFGSSLVSAHWNGAATYYRGIIATLHARGHRVTFYEPDAFERQQHRDIPDPEYARSVVFPATEEGVRRVLREARGAQVVVKASGVGVFDELLERTVLEQRRGRQVVIFWDVDAPATLDRAADPSDYFRPLIPEYDLVLTYGGGEPVMDAYAALGARRCVPVCNAPDPSMHHPVASDPGLDATLAPEQGRAIGAAAHDGVLAEHTYAHRGDLVDRLLREARAEKGRWRGRFGS